MSYVINKNSYPRLDTLVERFSLTVAWPVAVLDVGVDEDGTGFDSRVEQVEGRGATGVFETTTS